MASAQSSPPEHHCVADARFVLALPSGIRAVVAAHGATLVELHAPDRAGRLSDIVLGFDTDAEYRANPDLYFGATIGRVANRISGARFTLDGRVHRLAANAGPDHLHGGPSRSFDRVDWSAEELPGEDPAVRFTYVSPHLEEGYPGRVAAAVTYTLAAPGRLTILLEATTDRDTPVNLTNHTYWNLAGDDAAASRERAGTILDHELQIGADRWTPTGPGLIPTGAIEPVEGTPIDFRRPHTIGGRLAAVESGPTDGYDHNLVLDVHRPADAPAARLRHPATGRIVELRTDQPALQLYSGNSIPPVRGKHGRCYGRRSGLCLEPQGYPDAVNQPAFPSVILRAGTPYRRSIEVRLSAD